VDHVFHNVVMVYTWKKRGVTIPILPSVTAVLNCVWLSADLSVSFQKLMPPVSVRQSAEMDYVKDLNSAMTETVFQKMDAVASAPWRTHIFALQQRLWACTSVVSPRYRASVAHVVLVQEILPFQSRPGSRNSVTMEILNLETDAQTRARSSADGSAKEEVQNPQTRVRRLHAETPRFLDRKAATTEIQIRSTGAVRNARLKQDGIVFIQMFSLTSVELHRSVLKYAGMASVSGKNLGKAKEKDQDQDQDSYLAVMMEIFKTGTVVPESVCRSVGLSVEIHV